MRVDPRGLQQAAQQGASLVAFPELGLSAYTCDDLFHQRALLDACEAMGLPMLPGAAASGLLGPLVGALYDRVGPLPLVLPCHRVVRSDGSPGAYRGGPEAKRQLLDLEAAAG